MYVIMKTMCPPSYHHNSFVYSTSSLQMTMTNSKNIYEENKCT